MSRQSRHEKPLIEQNVNGKRIKNPNKIIINQHVIPNKHLLEWSKDGKMISVYDINSNESKTLPSSSPYFCVMRLWDQWTETKMLKTNEDNYQVQISLMKQGLPFTHIEHIMEYYVLLCVRIWVANKERPNYPSIFTSISQEHNKSELEENELEMEGTCHIIKGTTDDNSQHIARQIVKMAMNKAFIQWCEAIKDQNWLIYQSDEESFILSDALYNNYLKGIHLFPVNPKKVLITESTYKFLEDTNSLSVKSINNIMKANAVNYYVSYEQEHCG